MTAHAQTPPVAPAQQTSTVGNVLDQGGKKLTKDEATALVTGKVVSGVQGGDFKDVTFTNTYAADGTVMGNAWRSGKWFSKIKGKWWIDQSGQFCQDLLNDRQEKIASCQALYVVGASYYSARGDGRSAEVTWRTFSQ
jgi:hypothetical protein